MGAIPRAGATLDESKGHSCGCMLVHLRACIRVFVCVCVYTCGRDMGWGLGGTWGGTWSLTVPGWPAFFLPVAPRGGADAPAEITRTCRDQVSLERRRRHSHLQSQGFLIPEIMAPMTPLWSGPGPHSQFTQDAEQKPKEGGLGGVLPAAGGLWPGHEQCTQLSFLFFFLILFKFIF